MEDLIKAIEKLAEKDIIDYLIIIVPIAISVIAIIISIATAKKQNKIALFERRYSCLFQIKMILNFADTIQDQDIEGKIILGLYDSFWGTNIYHLKGDKQIIEAKSHLEILKKEVEQVGFLFNYKCSISPTDIIKAFNGVLFDAMMDKDLKESIDKFYSLCTDFTEKDFKKLQKEIKL